MPDTTSPVLSASAPSRSEEPILRIAVIGAGITGLAAAHRLATRCQTTRSQRNVQVCVLEASATAGGIIQTVQRDGFLVELGPDSFITNKPGAVELCEEIGFTDQLIPTDAAFRRSLVLSGGRPLPVPDGFMLMAPSNPWAILTTPILSWRGRLRLLSEAIIPRRKEYSADDDESLASFVRRRFGRETLERLVQPLVGGIYTSDPEKLSLQATLPRFPEMERQHGSVIAATLKQLRTASARKDQATSGSGARYGLFLTARLGLCQMIDALVRACQETRRITLELNCSVQRLTRTAPSASPRDSRGDGHPMPTSGTWQIQLQGEAEPRVFDAVIVTLPTHKAARLLQDHHFAGLRSRLEAIEYASSAIVVSGHRLSDFSEPLNAFGLVIPDREKRDILAVSFSSRKFPGRAPEGHVLLRTFVGGAMQPQLLDLPDDRILELVDRELTSLLGMHARPLFSQLVRYPAAMPQYHVGHLQRVAAIEQACSEHAGLQLAGSAYHGVGIPDSIASGRDAADAILSMWGSQEPSPPGPAKR